MNDHLVIDVYFDLICPWCLIGKRQLDLAVAELRRTQPAVVVLLRWHSVQLLTDLPAEGRDFIEFYLQRKGSAQAVRQGQQRVEQAAAALGITVDFPRIGRMPNTLQAHQLLAFARPRLAASGYTQLIERLLAAHFSLGEDLGARATLLAIAGEFELPAAALGEWLDAGMGTPAPTAVSGVPCFGFGQRLFLSGAQAPEQLLAAMHQSLARPIATPL